MYNKNYKNILKAKENKLIEVLKLLDNSIKNKIVTKNNEIKMLKQRDLNLQINEEYKQEKQKEINNFKLELNNILTDINDIIKNITK